MNRTDVTKSWPTLLTRLTAGESLTFDQARWAMDCVMSGQAGEAQLGGLLIGLAAKGESVDEVAGFADSMAAHARPLRASREALDIVGTGGDKLNTVNISTMSVIVAAASGAPVVKHGNRSSSSLSGSADVLEVLGVRLDCTPQEIEQTFAEIGIAFVFAQAFHPSMRYAAPARKQLGVPTIFNILGPLTNPAHPVASAIGTPSINAAGLIAGVLARRGTRGLVFRGHDGLDELTVTDSSTIWEIRGGEVQTSTMTPEEVGLGRWTIPDLTGGDAGFNADVVRRVLAGEKGAARDAVLLNAAGGLVAYDPEAKGSVVERIAAKVDVARNAIDSGAAEGLLERWIAASRAK